MADSGADFVHLHVHSQYSFLDGAIRVKDLVKRAKEMGAPAVALTDHGNMFGAITFYKTCKEAGIKGILGCELNVLHNDKKDARKDPNSGHGKHLVALARNEEGYKNLIHLVSMGYVDGKSSDGVPRVDVDLLSQHSRGLIGLSGCMGGGVAQAILEQGEDEGRRVAAKMKEIFDPGAFYLELQDHGFPEQPILNGILRQYCQELDLPRVATNDAHYPKRDDASAHLHLCCIGAGKTIEAMKEGDHGSQEIFLKSPHEMQQAFRDDPLALKNTLAITEQIELKLKLGIPMLPTFQVPEGSSIDDHFKHVSREGLERRFKEFEKIGKSVDHAGYRQRLEWELDVICKMKFPGYFLIVWDFIKYAKEHGIPVGPGRGSGAGSIVAYALRITDLDPLPYNLLFERFLNPERVSMPDFDIDFCMDRRQNVIEYVAEKYGMTSVGQIATFAELKAKSVIKDVGRVMGVSPAETQRLANLIPMKTPGQAYTIPESLEREPKLKALSDTDPRIKELLDQATKLEGLTRQAGMHAAGVVISEGPLWDHVPCFTGANGELVTQYYKDDVELAGLVKFDFLGLKTLTVLDIAVRLINERPDFKRQAPAEQSASGESKTLILDAIPMDDELTFKLLQSGECKGVFQLESSGMQSLFKDLKPTSFEDIVAAVALYRPGPLGTGMVKDFVDCRHGRKPIQSLHPLVDELLKPTYGVIVYQEQVMQIAQLLAGYSLGGADLLRRAMGKKKPEEMAQQKSIFVEGCIKNNVREEDGVRIFELLEYFAGYGFNKCVVGSTTIVDATTGERTTVKDLFHHRREFTVHSLNEKSGRLGPRAVTDVVWNGRRPVFELRTAQGKRIVATDNHPFYTLGGWRNLGELEVGDRIAAPRSLAVSSEKRWPRHEVIALAGLLSEGNTCHPTCLYFYNNVRELVTDFVDAVSQFSATTARIRERGARLEVCVSTGRDARFRKGQVPWNARIALGSDVVSEPDRSGAYAWAESLGILGVKATSKSVPADVFTLCDDDVALFLGRLWSGDGFIANATNFVPFYATSSRQLAHDVQTLLLRLGIASGVHTKSFKYHGTERPGYTVHVVGDGAIETFLERIVPHVVGRDGAVARLRAYFASVDRDRSSKDTIPADVRRWVNGARRAANLTWTELEARSGVCMKEFYGNGSAKKTGFRRSTIAKLAQLFASERLTAVSASDIFWDRVVAIEPRGIEDTFDLTVDVDHNFVADGLIVHNSHSAAYGLITYQTAYMKAHYPVEFMCASMSADKEKIDKVVRLIAEGRAMGVTILSPDINESGIDFSVVYETPEGDPRARPPFGYTGTGKVRDSLRPRIRFGLGAVRGIGEAAIQAILEVRQSGPFRDMFDFAARVDAKRINKGVFEALVHSGSLDSVLKPLAVSRASAAASVELALERSKAATKDRNAGQSDMFGLFAAASTQSAAAISGDRYVDAAAWDSRELLQFEKKSLGFYLTGHPLDRYGRLAVINTADVADQQERSKVKLAGMVEGYRERPMKTGGGKMAFFELEDRMGRIEVKVRPQQVDAFASVLASGEPIVLKGMIAYDRRNQDNEDEENASEPTPQILLDEAQLLSDFIRTETRSVSLRIAHERARKEQLQKLAELFRTCRGGCPVTLTLALDDGAEVSLALGQEFRVEASDPMLAGLERLFGDRVAELRTA